MIHLCADDLERIANTMRVLHGNVLAATIWVGRENRDRAVDHGDGVEVVWNEDLSEHVLVVEDS